MSVLYFLSFFVKKLHHVWDDSFLSFDIFVYLYIGALPPEFFIVADAAYVLEMWLQVYSYLRL